MKRYLSGILVVLLVLTNLFISSEEVFAQSASLYSDHIIVTNNLEGKADIVYVYGVDSGDLVKVYDSPTLGKLIAYATVASNKSEITFKIPQLETEDGSIYVSVVSKGEAESNRTKVAYPAEPKSKDVSKDNITITNNARKSDVVSVSGLDARDVVKVYNAPSEGKMLGSKTSSSGDEVNITVPQLGSSTGFVYVSVTNKNKCEGDRTAKQYSEEPVSSAPNPDNITINNNAKKTDNILVSGLSGGDIVKVYNSATGGKLLGSKTASTLGYEVTLTVSQLGIKAGAIFVTLTSTDCAESVRTEVEYAAELESDIINSNYITVTNNSGKPDTVYITGLTANDIIKVYNAAAKGNLLGTVTVSASGSDALVSIPQIGTAAGYVYVSVTSTNKNESSTRVPASYVAEAQSGYISSSNITVTNNVGKSDTVYVSNLIAGDTVRVYDSTSKVLLGSNTVTATGYDSTITISQLGTSEGRIYVSITNSGKLEGVRDVINYPSESKSSTPDAAYISITNNAGKSDTIYITKLSAGDLVKVYYYSNSGTVLGSSNSGTVLGSGTVAAAKSDLTITIPQLGTSTGGVHITITSIGKAESARTYVAYAGEGSSTKINNNNISITNNVSTADVVYVTGLSAGSVVRVYNKETSGSVLGFATVDTGKTDVSLTIPQLGTAAGSVYITITQPDLQESGKIKADYSTEGTSTDPAVNNIVVTNNVAKSDTVYINNLTGNDIVRIYDAATQGKILGTATVSSTETDTFVTIAQLGTREGSVYVTVTNIGKAESTRVKAEYKAESISAEVDSGNITVTNNAGKSDTVYITRLSTGDLVRVYDAEIGGTILGSATVANSATDVTVSVSQLGTGVGNVYVTVASTDKAESKRIVAPYLAETSSRNLETDQIVVTNNIAGIADTIYVSGLNSADVIKVYNAKANGTLLGTATVAEGDISASVSVTQLGTATGSVYVSVTSTGKLEGKSIEAKYNSEGKSSKATNIKVTNNAGAADTVYVSGLVANDVVNVYDADKGGNLLGSEKVTTYNSNVTVSIAQLGSTAGSVYVTISGSNKSESDRAAATYDKEPSSIAPVNITVINNAGSSDTVKVTGLTAGDVVKVYDTDTGGNTLGSETVAPGSVETTIPIAQLGSVEGKIFVTVTSTNKLESSRTTASYVAESISDELTASQVTIVNNTGIASTVLVKNLKDNDHVKVYNSASGGTVLGSGTVGTYNSEVTIELSKLSTAGGSVYISVTSTGKLESKITPIIYTSKVVSEAPNASSVTIINNYGIADTVKVKSLGSKTVIKLYSQETGGSAIGMATVADDSAEATVSLTQLGITEGSIYVTATSTGKTESSRTKVSYYAETTTEALAAGNITIVNNAGMSDTITVIGLEANSIVKVYNAKTGGTRLANVTAAADKLETTIYISQLGAGSGSTYVTVTRLGEGESSRTEVQYEAESIAAKASNITIVNNAGMSDNITVTGLLEKDVIIVYDSASGENSLGSAMVAAGGSKATINIAQLTKAAGYVYISVTNYGRAESSLTKTRYLAEQNTTAPYIGEIYVVNNVDIKDTITVYNLVVGDFIKVYSDSTAGNLLGYATVANNKTEATVSVDDLGTNMGVVYVSVTTKGKNESSRTETSYVAEGKSTAPYSGYIYITNNVTIADTILVYELAAGDKVKVYNSSTGGDLLGSATVASSGTQVNISIAQLGIEAGSVYVTVTSKGKTESNRTEAEYVSQQTTNEPYIGTIIVDNNKGTADKIVITKLSAADVIKVYDSESGGNLLGYITVATGSTTGTVTITQLGTSAGSLYVTVTSAGKAESNRTKVDYISE